MAVTYAKEYKGKYIGSLSQERADTLFDVIYREGIPELRQSVCQYPDTLIDESIKKSKSIRLLLSEKGLNGSDYLGALRDEQTIGLAFMYYSPRSILGDGVGLGKTVETAALINVLYAKGELSRFIMSVENSAVAQVRRELIRCTGLNIALVKGTGDKLRKELESIDWNTTHGLVLAHSKLTNEAFNLFLASHLTAEGASALFNTFILDESSVIKNQETNIYRSVKEICAIVGRVHFLNATTFELSLKDVYAQLDLLDSQALPKWWRIEKEHCIIEQVGYWKTENHRPVQKFHRHIAGYKNEEAFKSKIGLFFLGRSIEHLTVGGTYKVCEVYPSAAQKAAIRRGHRYMEVLNCPTLIDGLNIGMTQAEVPKLKALNNLLAERKGKLAFIYCFNIEAQQAIYDLAVEQGRKPLILNGGTPEHERQILVDKFNSGEADTLISNIKRSLNLYAGDCCIYYSVEGNPARMEQVRGRIDRHVDDKEKEFILLLYKGTEEYEWLVSRARMRSKAANDLTVESKTATDYFIDAMLRDEQIYLTKKGDITHDKKKAI